MTVNVRKTFPFYHGDLCTERLDSGVAAAAAANQAWVSEATANLNGPSRTLYPALEALLRTESGRAVPLGLIINNPVFTKQRGIRPEKYACVYSYLFTGICDDLI